MKKYLKLIIPLLTFWVSYFTAVKVGPALPYGFMEVWLGVVSIVLLAATFIVMGVLMVWVYKDSNYISNVE
jgi:hypothetical protein